MKRRRQIASPPDPSRRRFLMTTGAAGVAAGVAGVACRTPGATAGGRGASPPDLAALDHAPSTGYLLVDSAKCQGCATCMLACSLAHEGEANLSQARIQILQDPYDRYPHDIRIAQCRQCLQPACVEACPEGAMFVDGASGNVRRVDEGRCIGCGTCVEACPHPPGRVAWDAVKERPRKCDLCVDTPHWDRSRDGPRRLACVEVCPVNALALVSELPIQDGDAGYDVNLRDEVWEQLGYSRD